MTNNTLDYAIELTDKKEYLKEKKGERDVP